MIKKSFTIRVLIVTFLFLALPLLIDSFIFFQNSYNDAITDAKRSLQTEASYRAYNLLNMEPVRANLLTELVYIMNLSEKLQKPDVAQLNHMLSKIAHEGGGFQLYILNNEGPHYKILASSDPLATNQDYISFILLPEAIQRGSGTFIRFNYNKDIKRSIPYIFMVQDIYSPQTGLPLGVLMVMADVSEQLGALIQNSTLRANMKFAVLNRDSVIFAASEPGLLGQFFYPLSPERRTEVITSGQVSVQQLAPSPLPVIESKDYPFFEFIYNDQVQIAYRAAAPLGWISLMSYSPKEVFFGPAVGHFLFIYALYGIILVTGAAVAYWLSLWVSGPLRQLSECMTQVSQGKLNARFQQERLGFEINVLGGLFNHTLDNLLENIQKAEDERVKKQTYEKELAIVREVQKSSLPLEIPLTLKEPN